MIGFECGLSISLLAFAIASLALELLACILMCDCVCVLVFVPLGDVYVCVFLLIGVCEICFVTFCVYSIVAL